jgi:hypothetical protein
MLYKLTRQDFITRSGCLWGENVTHTADGQGALCSEHWLHAYEHPLIAVFMNPIHGDFSNPILWECDGIVGITDHGLKVGCTSLTTLRQIPLPVVTTEQCVRFAIACAVSVYQEPSFISWAMSWIYGTDRSRKAALAAAAAWAESAAEAAALAAAWAEAAAWAAAAAAVWAACAATKVVAPREAAKKAAWAAAAETPTTEGTLDLVTCAEWAMSDNINLPIVIKEMNAVSYPL